MSTKFGKAWETVKNKISSSAPKHMEFVSQKTQDLKNVSAEGLHELKGLSNKGKTILIAGAIGLVGAISWFGSADNTPSQVNTPNTTTQTDYNNDAFYDNTQGGKIMTEDEYKKTMDAIMEANKKAGLPTSDDYSRSVGMSPSDEEASLSSEDIIKQHSLDTIQQDGLIHTAKFYPEIVEYLLTTMGGNTSKDSLDNMIKLLKISNVKLSDIPYTFSECDANYGRGKSGLVCKYNRDAELISKESVLESQKLYIKAFIADPYDTKALSNIVENGIALENINSATYIKMYAALEDMDHGFIDNGDMYDKVANNIKKLGGNVSDLDGIIQETTSPLNWE